MPLAATISFANRATCIAQKLSSTPERLRCVCASLWFFFAVLRRTHTHHSLLGGSLSLSLSLSLSRNTQRRFRRCRNCQLRENIAGYRRRRDVRSSRILRNLRAVRRRQDALSTAAAPVQRRRDLLEVADVDRILAAWQNRSALSGQEAAANDVTLALLDPAAELAPQNLVAITVDEAHRHALGKISATQRYELRERAQNVHETLFGATSHASATAAAAPRASIDNREEEDADMWRQNVRALDSESESDTDSGMAIAKQCARCLVWAPHLVRCECGDYAHESCFLPCLACDNTRACTSPKCADCDLGNRKHMCCQCATKSTCECTVDQWTCNDHVRICEGCPIVGCARCTNECVSCSYWVCQDCASDAGMCKGCEREGCEHCPNCGTYFRP